MSLRESVSVLGETATSEAAPARTQEHPPLAFQLPEEPLVVIAPSRRRVSLGLRDLWTYRELLYFLVWRDVKVRYKQTALGVVWVVAQPLLTTLIFTIFLGMLAKVPSDGAPYPLFVFAGLLPWTFFSGAVATSGNSLVGNAHLITKVYFPRMIIPIAAVGARLVDFFVAFLVLAGMMIYYGQPLTWKLLALPLLILLVTALALGVGMWASALNVRYRDVGVAVPVLIQLWMFASPVVYPLNLVPENWRTVYALNPAVGVVSGFRAALLGGEFEWAALAVSAAVTLVVLILAAYSFRRMEKFFADLV
ncbi:MAG TPA: ABC transporter permease [Pyrinomonadaceae bacterium]|nr:ABC transporter permease [Pyrinomonadaceae bacterium]